MGGGGAADDGGASGSGSHFAIVPSSEGPSSAPSPSSLTSWLPLADREALLSWIESSPFVFIDRQHHESARAWLVEAEGAESSLRRQLEEARDAEKAVGDAEKAVEDALWRANAVVGELTSQASGAEARIKAMRAELQGRDRRIHDLEAQVVGLNSYLEAERADRSELIDQLDDARLAAQGLAEKWGPGEGPPLGDGPPPLADAQKLALAEAEVAQLKTQLVVTEEAVRVERRRNFADGFDRATWEVERTTMQRAICILHRSSAIRVRVLVYEELHSGLQEELTKAFGRTRAEEDSRLQWELLRKYDTSVHSLAAFRLSTHEVVKCKYISRHYDPVLLEGIDLKMIMVRGNKAMWPSAARDVWNTANQTNDLERLMTFFPGWAPLAPVDGGTIGFNLRAKSTCRLPRPSPPLHITSIEPHTEMAGPWQGVWSSLTAGRLWQTRTSQTGCWWILHAGTANSRQAHRRHGEPAQPRLVELSDDEDAEDR
ncbi:hypothetical protein R1sor_021785 [Riccia sorocarpa]|uniref:Uncharacterized protein n=1 Tax=Riccia sorocarpa TaxID=122646 RepID=A0ABD3GNT2_9MARC